MLLFLLRAPVAYLRINPQVEEVPEYLRTIPALLLLLYCTYNALSKYILSYINKNFYTLFIFSLWNQTSGVAMPVSHLNLITFSQKYIPAFIYTIFLTFDIFKAGTFLTLL